MTIHVLCPKCRQQYGVENDRAGSTATCPACGAMARIPDVDPTASPFDAPGGPNSQDPYRSPQAPAGGGMPYYGGVDPYAQADLMKFEVHRRVLGILGIVACVLTALWGGMMALEAILFSEGALPVGPGSPPPEVMVTTCVVLAILAFGTAAVQLLGGILLLARTRACRVWGIIAAVAGCISLWTFCVYPVNLGIGIYGLVILCGRTAGEALR